MDRHAPGQLAEVRTSAQLLAVSEPGVRGAALIPEAVSVEPLPDSAAVPKASQSFEAVYEEQVDFVWRNAQRFGIGDDALDDVVQQVFLVVHRRLAEAPLDVPMRAWVFGILSHVVRDHRRGVRRKSPHHAQPQVDVATVAEPAGRGPFDALARTEALHVVLELLADLSADKREIFVLSELEQLTAQEIAELLAINVNTVYSRLRAARQDFERAAERARHRDTWRLR